MAAPGPDAPAPPPAGLYASLRRLLATLLDIGQVRLDLLSAELEREKLRIFDGLVWAAVALLFIGLGLLLLAALLVALAPEAWRPLLLAGLALASLGLGAWLMQQARRHLASPGGPVPASRSELAQDRAALRAPD